MVVRFVLFVVSLNRLFINNILLAGLQNVAVQLVQRCSYTEFGYTPPVSPLPEAGALHHNQTSLHQGLFSVPTKIGIHKECLRYLSVCPSVCQTRFTPKPFNDPLSGPITKKLYLTEFFFKFNLSNINPKTNRTNLKTITCFQGFCVM